MIRAWRLVKAKHATTAFSGFGARIAGGRWNSKGADAVYVSCSIALAAVEVLAHLNIDEVHFPYVTIAIDLPNDLVEELGNKELPRDWRDFPPPASTRILGDAWLADPDHHAPALRVPSAVIPDEHDYLLNTRHPDFSKFEIQPPEPFSFDPRLIKTS